MSAAQNVESLKVAVVLVSVAAVIYWRTVIKLLIMALAIAVISLLSFGAFVIFEGIRG
jgi:hypothetical protein